MPKLFLGFMDEEVADILETLVSFARGEGRPIVIIERGTPNELALRLFERSTLEYLQKDTRISFSEISMDGQGDSNRRPAWDRPGVNLAPFVSQLESPQFQTRRQRRTVGGRQVKVQGKLCMLTVSPLPVLERQPYILVRSPEMGLQPDLTRMYLRAIFKALSDSQYGNLEISCFGAGGAAAAGLTPGTADDVLGSFYVGFEAARELDDPAPPEPADASDPPASNDEQFYGVVKFAALTKVPAGLLRWASDEKGQRLDFGLFRTQRRYRYDQAIALASRAFCLMAGTASGGDRGDPSLEALPANLAQHKTELRTLVRNYTRNSINLTAAVFAGDDLKTAARALQVGEVNMEDYHVVRVLNSASAKYSGLTITASQITRVHCDPPEITGSLEHQFRTWARTVEYTRDQFKAAVQWGRDGCRLDKLPPVAHWTLADAISNPGSAVYACRKACAFQGKVRDPFFSEIASDFLLTVRATHAFPKTGMRTAVVEQLAEHADAILTASRGKPSEVDKILDAMLAGASYETGASPFSGTGGKLRVWVRPDKWADGSGNGNDKVVIDQVTWEGARIDRALYKSTNQVVLQEMAAGRVR